MRKRYLLLCGILVFVLALGGIATAMIVSPITNLTATDTDTEHEFVGMSGEYVVWDTSYSDLSSNIFLFDLTGISTPNPVQITTDGVSFAPNIDGDRIVYAHFDGGRKYSIRMHTISNPGAGETILEDYLYTRNSTPDISGDHVVFISDEFDGAKRVMFLDLADADPEPVMISSLGLEACGRPAVSGDHVVYRGDEAGVSSIYLNDVSAGGAGEAAITDLSDNFQSPNIDGNTVVFSNGGGDTVFSYDINSELTKQINPAAISSQKPNIQGNNIVYAGYDSTLDEEAIYFYNLITGLTTVASHPEAEQWCCPDVPAVAGNNVAWVDHWNYDNDNVYQTKITPTFDTVPGLTGPINITEDQVITQNPYIIKVYPTAGSEIVRVEFFIDNILIGTIYAPNSEGIWECPWDTSKYHSLVTVVAYDAAGESITIERNTTVMLELPYTGI